jgi:hypothetical protein
MTRWGRRRNDWRKIGDGVYGPQRTRDEHLTWCKDRALELVDAGRLQEAVETFARNLAKHPETRNRVRSPQVLLSATYLDSGDPIAVRKWVRGFQ